MRAWQITLTDMKRAILDNVLFPLSFPFIVVLFVDEDISALLL